MLSAMKSTVCLSEKNLDKKQLMRVILRSCLLMIFQLATFVGLWAQCTCNTLVEAPLDSMGVGIIGLHQVIDNPNDPTCDTTGYIVTIIGRLGNDISCADINDTLDIEIRDAAGMPICSSRTVTRDTIGPIITCPPDITLDCGEEITPQLNPLLGTVSVVQGCVDDLDTTFVDNNVDTLDCTNKVVTRIARTWFVSDTLGNTDSCLQRIYLIDTIDPGAACNNFINVQLGLDGEVVILPSMLDAANEDNCGIMNMWVDIEGLDDSLVTCANAGDTLKVQLFIQDFACNINMCWGNVHVEEKIPPLITCNDVTIDCERGTHPDSIDLFGVPMGFGYPTASDLCGIDTIIYTDQNGTNACMTSP